MKIGTGGDSIVNDLQIGQLMTAVVSCVPPDADLASVSRMMRDRRFSCLVVEEAMRPLGIITERDLVRYMADAFDDRELRSVIAAQVMSTPPVTVKESDTLYDAMVITRAHGIRHLLVVTDAGEFAGLVTQSDITKAYFKLFEDLRGAIERSMNERTQELLAANERLKALSLEDPLLNVGNRRAMEVDLGHTHAAALRYKRPYSVTLFDIDCFKLYNDHYGHLAGDNALKLVAETLNRSIRATDRLYRYGGEEFLVLCPETPLEGALTLANRLIESVRKKGLDHCKSPHSVVTLSGGAANVGDHSSWTEVVGLADKALYEAKNKGRNQVTFALND